MLVILWKKEERKSERSGDPDEMKQSGMNIGSEETKVKSEK